MLYPFTLLLWAVFFPAQPSTQPTPPAHPHFSPVVVGDSSVFNILAARLKRRGDETRPEKLYLHLDRTLFQPGETLWFNAYLRNAGDLLPAKVSEILYVEL
ncbi:MAG: hypothetical protein ACKVU2_11675, partial [Saprospiraceae bacterium]